MASGRLRFPILFVLCMLGISAAFAQTSPPPAPEAATIWLTLKPIFSPR